MSGVRARLADHLASLDAARFTGRVGLLARIDRLMATPDAPTRVVIVHGPGGIGKSALLREIGRRGAAAGRPVWAVDARALEPLPGELEQAVAGAADLPGAVVTIDSFERVQALDGLLRERVLPGLAADALVVVAGRLAPTPAWFHDGWEHVVTEVALGPLPAGEARDLLAALGVTDPTVAGPVVDWAGGSPLALSLAAASGAHAEGLDLAGVDLNRLIVRRLAGDELGALDGDVVEVAAIARAVDARLLSAVLPGRPTRAANEALRRVSVAELVGARVTLHDLVRTAVRDDLRQRDPRRYAQLRCAIADHLLFRATDGEPRLLSDLMELVDDPEVRWGIGGDASDRVRIDPWRPDEVDALIDGYVTRMGDPRWWDELAPLLAHAPETGLVARDVDGVPLGFCVATSAARAPSVAETDPVLAPLLADARAWGAEGSMIFRESFGMPGSTGPGSQSVLHLSAVLRSGVGNVERSYIVDTAPNPDSTAFLRAVGAVHRTDLDAHLIDRTVECWVIDHGPGGMLGQVRDVVYAEAGALAPSQAQRRDEELRRAALDALRDYGRSDALAANPLVAGSGLVPAGRAGAGPPADATAAQRAAWLRDAVCRALDAAFGASAADVLLRQVAELGDLDPAVTHDQAMARLSVSRATYFRHLRQARQRIAASLVEQLAGPGGPPGHA